MSLFPVHLGNWQSEDLWHDWRERAQKIMINYWKDIYTYIFFLFYLTFKNNISLYKLTKRKKFRWKRPEMRWAFKFRNFDQFCLKKKKVSKKRDRIICPPPFIYLLLAFTHKSSKPDAVRNENIQILHLCKVSAVTFSECVSTFACEHLLQHTACERGRESGGGQKTASMAPVSSWRLQRWKAIAVRNFFSTSLQLVGINSSGAKRSRSSRSRRSSKRGWWWWGQLWHRAIWVRDHMEARVFISPPAQ